MTDRYLPSAIDRWGTGRHGIKVDACPHCGRPTRIKNFQMKSMWVKAAVCPVCSKGIVTRLIHRVKDWL